MNLNDYLQCGRGRGYALAKKLGIAPGQVSHMAWGKRPVHPSMVQRICAFTGGQVRPWDLRPDDWWLIWPELIGTDGAPAVPAQMGQAA